MYERAGNYIDDFNIESFLIESNLLYTRTNYIFCNVYVVFAPVDIIDSVARVVYILNLIDYPIPVYNTPLSKCLIAGNIKHKGTANLVILRAALYVCYS